MTSRELVVRTLNHEPVPRVPRDLWIPSGVKSLSADELAEMSVRYPSDIEAPPVAPTGGKRSAAKTPKRKQWTDVWGCVWREAGNGAPPELKRSPLTEAGRIASFQPPAELFERSRFNRANRRCSQTNRFVLAWSEVRPFDRLRFLRGGEAALLDLARGGKESRDLLAVLHDAACKELERWGETEVDGVAFRDDWASPDGLLVAPEMWREIFKPQFKILAGRVRDHGLYVWMHSCGKITDIIPDLIECGVNVLQFDQPRLHGVDRLAEFAGKVTFQCPVDIQTTLQTRDPELIRAGAKELVEKLGSRGGGFVAGYYGGNRAIGITPEVQDHACKAFVEFGTYR